MLWVQGLQWVQAGLTLLYVMTVLSMVSYVNGELLGVLVYDSLPSVVGVVLARRAVRGGEWVARGLVAVQCWLLWLSFVSLLHMDYRGVTQTAIPIAVLVLLRRPEVRDWFALPVGQREMPRAFRIERMILWRRDLGQTAMEYLGLVLVVVAVVGGLVATGIGQELTGKIGAQVCRIGGGGDCGGGSGGGSGGADVEAGDPAEAGDAGGTGSGGGSGGTGGTGGSGDAGDVVVVSGDGGTRPIAPGPLEREVDNDDFKEDPDEPLIPDERHDRSWWDHTRGFFVSPFTGLVNDTFAVITNPKKVVTDSWNGLTGYTKDWWKKKGGSVSEKWKKGDKLGAAWEGTKKGLGFAKDLGVDMFVDKENWKKGNYGAAGGNTILGVVGILSPKTFKKFTKLGKIKKPKFPDTAVGRAAEAAGKADEAAKRGDLSEAQKFADEAQKHADDAAEKARESQKKACKNIAMAPGRVVVTGTAGGAVRPGPQGVHAAPAVFRGGVTGTVVRTSAAECGPGDEAVKSAREAQQEALDAQEAVLREAMRQAKGEGKEGPKVQPKALDDFLARAEDDPAWDSKGYSKKEAADALAHVTELMGQKNVQGLSREMLAYKVLNAPNKDKLAEGLAEANAARRVAQEEVADGAIVYSALGTGAKRLKEPDGKGGELDARSIADADVIYRGKDGRTHVVEVKNTGNATTQASTSRQIEALGKWQREAGDGAGRRARYQIETRDGWAKIFDRFQKAKSKKPEGRIRPPGTPASQMAQSDVGARIAGTDFTPQQLKAMDNAVQERTRGMDQAAKDGYLRGLGKKHPNDVMRELGVA
ncbi:hypothetical protein [Streptomyces sp. NBC_00385]|uniref:hypothetical protein n=1 Tax=Streptomyces sp. NBC_00385 TaxID=2975733 RepID=UPI002DDB9086|nr:hypothetical protein [Streptomyces sp. NBC_00385]WRZ06465.1 hypothetical protein OG959_25545 [Streptomyces sp. NBC_00385]